MESYTPVPFLEGGAGRVTDLDQGWELCEQSPCARLGLASLEERCWKPASVPGTAGAVLRAPGAPGDERDLDAHDYVYRCRFPRRGEPGPAALVFEGLATLAEVWLNGDPLLTTDNMFRRYAADVTTRLREDNELIIHFRSLAAVLGARKGRARWTTRLVRQRNLRFARTSLLGRMPGWSPPPQVVGPWRGVRLLEARRVAVERLALHPSLEDAGARLRVALEGRTLAGEPPSELEIEVAGHRARAPLRPRDGDGFEGELDCPLPGVEPWWPHGLGAPRRYPVKLALDCGGDRLALGATKVGFRRLQADPLDGGFGLLVNGVPVFCRGACWTPEDPLSLQASEPELRRTLTRVRDAGMNMLRISGTLVYESDLFYELCDDLGILVWQDFMFASMDYPGDAAFLADVQSEAEQLLARLQHRPSLAVLCGGSEVEQQAAMMGLPADEVGRSPLFRERLRACSARWCPEVPYLPSSPCGGSLPFRVDSGIAHYFGVGAYLRPPADARESGVRFASECLAFSNVPDDEALDELFAGESRVVHSPRYKRGVPRDGGAGWDFADVTDHYLESLFRCEARALRYADPERYLALSRVVPGVLMEQVVGSWRAEGSRCRGALVWLLRDLVPGAGWGILDHRGRPKAPYYFLKRAFAPRTLWLVDEGLNGLRVHVRNDGPESLTAQLELELVRSDGLAIERAEASLNVPPHAGTSRDVEALLGRFVDVTHAYRFGPCEHAVCTARLRESDGTLLAEAHHLPLGLAHEVRADLGLRAVATPCEHAAEGGGHELCVETASLALFVHVSAPGYAPSDDYFHLAPGRRRTLRLSPEGGALPLSGRVTALNSRRGATIVIEEAG